MSAIGSRNAMFVLRMVLDHRPAWTPFRAYSAPNESLFSFTSKHSAVEAQPVTNFLDDDVDEYQNIKPSLPPRDRSHHSLPWPTVFASETAVAQQNERRMCDTLYRLVSRQEYSTAQSILHELDQHGVPVWPQDIYLNPAIYCLETGNKEGFFRWFKLISTRQLPLSDKDRSNDQRLLQPVLHHISTTCRMDVDFMRRFLLESGNIGVLPTVFRTVVAQLATIASPVTTLPAVKDALEAYRSGLVLDPASSTGTRQEEAVGDFMEESWNYYLRKLLYAGHLKEAKILHQTMKIFNSEINWTPHTQQVLLRMMEPRARSSMPSLDRTLSLDERIVQAINTGARPQDVSKVISALFWKRAYARLAEFEKAFVGGDENRQNLWTLAEMISLRETGQRGPWHLHLKAIKKFSSRFVWEGLPPLPEYIESDTSMSGTLRKQPSIREVNAIISSIQAITPASSASFHAWHKQYLDSVASFPPSLHPDAYTHRTIIRGFIRYLGPIPAEQAIRNIVRAGLNPGQTAVEELLYSYARQGRSSRLAKLIQAMEERKTEFGIELSPPSEAAYVKVQRLLEIRMPATGSEPIEDEVREMARG